MVGLGVLGTGLPARTGDCRRVVLVVGIGLGESDGLGLISR
jgi:hypothetical protein